MGHAARMLRHPFANNLPSHYLPIPPENRPDMRHYLPRKNTPQGRFPYLILKVAAVGLAPIAAGVALGIYGIGH
jgi:hypothetical protein